jgi:DNA modification methylase
VAQDALQALAYQQLQNAIDYLQTIQKYDSPIPLSAHEDYHNLRKQLRSLVDEYEVLQDVMFPFSPATKAAAQVLVSTRTFLGNINDDWTADMFYIDHGDEHHHEQARLEERLELEWHNFLTWAKTVDLEGSLAALRDSMTSKYKWFQA